MPADARMWARGSYVYPRLVGRTRGMLIPIVRLGWGPVWSQVWGLWITQERVLGCLCVREYVTGKE